MPENINQIYCFPENITENNFANFSGKQVLRLSSGGFCFAFLDDNKLISVNHSVFLADNLSDCQKLEMLHAENLRLNISKNADLHVVYHTLINTQIPNGLYSSAILEKTKNILVANEKDYHFECEEITDFDLLNISAWGSDVYEKIQTLFPTAKLTSLSSVLLRLFATINENILLFFDTRHVSILVKENHKLLGMNTFYFSNEADCCYYIFAFLRNVYPDYSQISPILCGNIDEISPLYQTLCRYFSKVNLIHSENKEKYQLYCDIFFV